MSYFAQIQDGIVVDVISADQSFIDQLPNPSEWIQTSYNTRGNVHYGQDGQPDGGIALRGNFAGLGYTYDVQNDVFYPQKPYPSWLLDESTWLWVAPIPAPTTGGPYQWDEQLQEWVPIG
jgi:hypothetical protein